MEGLVAIATMLTYSSFTMEILSCYLGVKQCHGRIERILIWIVYEITSKVQSEKEW